VDGLAVGLANVVHLFNPDLIILGGGVSEGLSQLNLMPRIRERIHDRLMSELHKVFDLVPSVLGDNSGLLGAAAAAWQMLEET
jgi:glucokinase